MAIELKLLLGLSALTTDSCSAFNIGVKASLSLDQALVKARSLYNNSTRAGCFISVEFSGLHALGAASPGPLVLDIPGLRLVGSSAAVIDGKASQDGRLLTVSAPNVSVINVTFQFADTTRGLTLKGRPPLGANHAAITTKIGSSSTFAGNTFENVSKNKK